MEATFQVSVGHQNDFSFLKVPLRVWFLKNPLEFGSKTKSRVMQIFEFNKHAYRAGDVIPNSAFFISQPDFAWPESDCASDSIEQNAFFGPTCSFFWNSRLCRCFPMP
jgi:hypothetical protein